MHFSEKLQLLRKKKGYTQEQLAEELNVSRQAVTKWEAGLVYPDIETLIQISNHMHVSIDYLVRDQEYSIKPIRITIKDLNELQYFKLKTNHNNYAAFVNETKPSCQKTHEYRYEEAPYVYYDSYLGDKQFVGEEIIWRKDQAVYAMNYTGRIIKEPFDKNFLREALHASTIKMPYRGPEFYQSGEHIYHCKIIGQFSWFQGREAIFRNQEKIYECFFHGGILR